MNHVPPGAADLSQLRGAVPIQDHRILAPSAIEVRPNGLEIPNCVAHVRVIDVPRMRAYYVPLTLYALHAMHDNFGVVITDLTTREYRREHDDNVN